MFTVGHSSLAIESFLRALTENRVAMLVDVRTMPRSRYNPQFNNDALALSLQAAGIGYRHEKRMGGLRKPQKDSINAAWRNDSFRGYADYMQTSEFQAALAELAAEPDLDHTTVMCAEAVPWRCHRSLIADAMLARGMPVENIFIAADGKSHRKPAVLASFAQVKDGHVWYPAPDAPMRGLFDK